MTSLLITVACLFAMSCSVRFPGGVVVSFLWRLAHTAFWFAFIEGLAILI